MAENNVEEDIEILEEIKNDYLNGFEYYTNPKAQKKADAIEHILSEYTKLENKNKEWDKEFRNLQRLCFKLHKSWLKENQYYKDLIHALETYYDIRREDLEKYIKNDKWKGE